MRRKMGEGRKEVGQIEKNEWNQIDYARKYQKKKTKEMKARNKEIKNNRKKARNIKEKNIAALKERKEKIL